MSPQNFQLVICFAAVLSFLFFAARKIAKNDFGMVVVLLLLTVAVGHGQAVLALLAYVAASAALGAAIRKKFLSNQKDELGAVYQVIVSIFLGFSLNSYLCWAAMHFNINYPIVYWSVLAVQLLLFRRSLMELLDPLGKSARTFTFSQKILVFHAGLTLVYQLVPSYTYDELVSHLFIPHSTLLHGKFDFSPFFTPGLNTSVTPIGAYTALFLLGSESAVRLFNYLLFYFGFLAVDRFTEKRLGTRTAYLAVLVALSFPYVLWCYGAIFIDSFNFLSSAILCIETLLFVRARLTMRRTCFIAVISAATLLCKQQGILVLLPSAAILLCFFVKEIWRSKTADSLLYAGGAGFLFLLLLAPPMLYNYVVSGNPIFPFYNLIFRSPFFELANFRDTHWLQPLSWRTLSDLTFHGSLFIENTNYAFGFSCFVFLWFALPLAVLTNHNPYSTELRFLAFYLLTFPPLLFLSTGLYMRYFAGALFPTAIILGYGIHRFLSLVSGKLWLTWLLSLSVLIVLSLNFAAQFSLRNITNPYPVYEAFRHDYSNSTAGHYAEQKSLFKYAALRHGNSSKGLILEKPWLYFAEGPIESYTWYFPTTSAKLSKAATAKELYDLIFHELGFHYLVIPSSSTAPLFSSTEFKRRLSLKMKRADLELFEPKH